MKFKVRFSIISLILVLTAFAAPPPIQSLRITTPEPPSTALLNLTATIDKTNLTDSNLSDDFINVRVYGTPITVQFYDRNHNLSPNITRLCLRRAASDCNAHHVSGMSHAAVGARALWYSAGTAPQSVRLELSPQPQLTWDMWTKVVDALIIVQENFGFKKMFFAIIWELSPGSERVDGVGRMWETWR